MSAGLGQPDGEEGEGRHRHAETGHPRREDLDHPEVAAHVDDRVAGDTQDEQEEDQGEPDAEDEDDGLADERSELVHRLAPEHPQVTRPHGIAPAREASRSSAASTA